MTRTFGWTGGTTLTGTTRYGIEALCASSNAIPVWVDEYRDGARSDTKLAFDQMVRDAWDAKSTFRGGVNRSNYMELTERPAIAPIIVTGEAPFTETSHLERSAVIEIPKEGRNFDALQVLRASNMRSFGLTYLAWLAHMHRYRFDDLPVPTADPLKQGDRPAWVRAVIEWGWELLRMFVEDVKHFDIGEPNLELLDVTLKSARESNPILDALAWSVGVRSREDSELIVWLEEKSDDVYVRVQKFINLATSNGFVLPTRTSKGITEFLKAHFGLPKEHPTIRRNNVRVFVIPNGRAEIEERQKHLS